MKKIFLIISLFIFEFSIAQTSKSIDSLEHELKYAKESAQIDLLNKLSNAYFSISQKKSFETARNALKLSSQLRKPEYISQSYFNFGSLHHKISNYDSALYFYNKALKTSINNENTVLILDNIGNIYKDKSKYDSSLLFHNQSLKLKETLADRQGVALTYNNIGNVYNQMRKYDDALEYYQISLEIRRAKNEKQAIAALLNNIGDVYKNLSQYEKALTCFNEALQIQKELNDKASIAYTLNGIGNFYFQLKIYDKAQEFYTKALEIRLELGNKNDIAASKFNIATVHRDIGNYKDALKYYSMALELRRETGAKEAEALTLTAIGGVYKNKKLYGLAIQNYELALTMHKKMGSKVNIANAYERIGIAYKDTCLFDKAEKYYIKALENFNEIGNINGVARIQNYLGNLYKEKNNFNQSFSYYKESFALYDSAKNISGMAYVSNNLGDLHQKFNKNKDAINYYLKSKKLAEECKETSLLKTIAFSLYTMYKNKYDFAKALEYFEEYSAIKDTLAHNKNIERIAELEFESDVKLLEKANENQELKLREEQTKQVQFKLYLIIALIILLGILGFSILLYKQYSQKEKAYNLLTEKSTELEHTYTELAKTNSILKEKDEKITDSLSYAKRIQKAILPNDSNIKRVFPNHFIFYLPKEIVSGDFYWFAEHEDFAFFAVVDCTGHGVPGAFMSMVGNTLLNQIVNELHVIEPSEILQKLDTEIIKTLRQYDEHTKQEDGMEISLLRYHKITKKITFSGAGHKLLIAENNTIKNIPSTHFSIGGMHTIKQDRNVTFPHIEINITPGTILYMLSDGFIDQFGGEKDERFSSTRFQKLLSEIQHFDMNEQYIQLSKIFDDWKGSSSQIDDVLVVGIQF